MGNMGDLFGHERLSAYRKAMEFVAIGDSLLQGVERRAAACDHLARAMEGVPLQIAHANNSWSDAERTTYFGHANGSVLECAACLDVLVAKQMLRGDQTSPAKILLREICSMLITLQQTAPTRVREASPVHYSTTQEPFFSHERLDVYQVALQFVALADHLCGGLSSRPDVADRLDKGSTGIVLNIAEGNGRFSAADHVRFLRMARSAVVQSVATLDLAVARCCITPPDVADGRAMLGRIAAMLTAMAKRVATASLNLSRES